MSIDLESEAEIAAGLLREAMEWERKTKDVVESAMKLRDLELVARCNDILTANHRLVELMERRHEAVTR